MIRNFCTFPVTSLDLHCVSLEEPARPTLRLASGLLPSPRASRRALRSQTPVQRGSAAWSAVQSHHPGPHGKSEGQRPIPPCFPGTLFCVCAPLLERGLTPLTPPQLEGPGDLLLGRPPISHPCPISLLGAAGEASHLQRCPPRLFTRVPLRQQLGGGWDVEKILWLFRCAWHRRTQGTVHGCSNHSVPRTPLPLCGRQAGRPTGSFWVKWAKPGGQRLTCAPRVLAGNFPLLCVIPRSLQSC